MFNSSRIYFLLATTALLSGCAAIDSVNTFIDERNKKEEDARFATATVACKRYGFSEGSPQFPACLQTEVNNIKNREAIEAAAAKSVIQTKDASLPTTTNCVKTLMGVQCTTQ
jgi:hypothetical protein